MNYAAHYERLIARARSRSLVGYRERHHVLPRCMGGGNEKENIVEMSATRRGRKQSPEAIANNSAARRGKKYPKISLSLLGNTRALRKEPLLLGAM